MIRVAKAAFIATIAVLSVLATLFMVGHAYYVAVGG